MDALPYIGIALLLLISGFFSASEIAYTSVNKLRLRRTAENGNKRAKLAGKIHDRYDAVLYTILIGNNLVNIVASSLATVIAIKLAGDSGAGIASLVMTVLIILLGEIIPKTIGKQKADSFVQIAAYPLRMFMILFKPVVIGIEWLVKKTSRLWRKDGEDPLPTVTEEEFAAILETAEDEGVIDEERTELLQSALEFDDITAQEVLTPRMDIYAIDIEDSPEEIHETVINARYSRIPVYKDSIDNIVGILYVNKYLKEYARNGRVDVGDIMQTPLFFHKTMKLDDALSHLRRQHIHVAVVLDEFGGTLGIVTMEDILEELVGEIWDESDDVVDECVQTGEHTFECEGSMALHDFFDQIDFDDEDFESEYTTVGGWAIEMLDAMPSVGDTFEYKNLTITVLLLDSMRVERVRVEVDPVKEED